jgi:hypothetical protein
MPNLCSSCVHFKDGKCDAFPRGIPLDIVLYGGDHRSLWPQQVGSTVHVLQNGLESRFDDWLDTYVFVPD